MRSVLTPGLVSSTELPQPTTTSVVQRGQTESDRQDFNNKEAQHSGTLALNPPATYAAREGGNLEYLQQEANHKS